MPVLNKAKKAKSESPWARGRSRQMTDKQQKFVTEYLACMNSTQAAIAAGVSPKQAPSVGCQWLNQNRYPLVAQAVANGIAEHELKAEKKAADILQYIHTGMFFEPLKFFKPGNRGGWLIDEEGFENLPPYIGRLIEEVEKRVKAIYDNDGNLVSEETVYWVKLVSKTAMTALAAKYQLTEQHLVGHVTLPWEALEHPPEKTGGDVIEGQLALPAPTSNGKANGRSTTAE